MNQDKLDGMSVFSGFLMIGILIVSAMIGSCVQESVIVSGCEKLGATILFGKAYRCEPMRQKEGPSE